MDDRAGVALRALNQALQAWFKGAWGRLTDPGQLDKHRDSQMAQLLGISDDLVRSMKGGTREVQMERVAAIAALEGKTAMTVWSEIGLELSRGPHVPAPGSKQGGRVTPILQGKMKKPAP